MIAKLTLPSGETVTLGTDFIWRSEQRPDIAATLNLNERYSPRPSRISPAHGRPGALQANHAAIDLGARIEFSPDGHVEGRVY